MEKHGIYHIVFITRTSPTNLEWCLPAVLNWMEDQLTRSFFHQWCIQGFFGQNCTSVFWVPEFGHLNWYTGLSNGLDMSLSRWRLGKNQLVVFFLTKFRENRVTFMDDIGKMYFSEHHISCLLQFLWWKERNILDKPSVCSCVWRCFIWSLQQLQSENDVSWEQGQISWRACSNFARQLLCGWPVKVSWNWRQGSSVIKGYKSVPWRRVHFTNNKKIVLQSTQRKTNNQVLRTKIL